MSKTNAPASSLPQQPKRRISPGIIVVIVLVLALAGGVGVQYWRGHSKVEVSSNGKPEPTVITGPGTSGKGVTVGNADAKVHIDIYLDFRCPHCAEFEEASGATVDASAPLAEVTMMGKAAVASRRATVAT